MEEYIKRSDVLKNIEDLRKSPWYNNDNGFGSRIVKKDALDVTRDLCVLDVPAEDVKEVIHAKWENIEPYRTMDGKYLKGQICGNCHAFFVSNGNEPYSNHPFCCECGSQMDL